MSAYRQKKKYISGRAKQRLTQSSGALSHKPTIGGMTQRRNIPSLAACRVPVDRPFAPSHRRRDGRQLRNGNIVVMQAERGLHPMNLFAGSADAVPQHRLIEPQVARIDPGQAFPQIPSYDARAAEGEKSLGPAALHMARGITDQQSAQRRLRTFAPMPPQNLATGVDVEILHHFTKCPRQDFGMLLG